MTTEELLQELQSRHAEGLVALTLPDSLERLYLWWGDRTFCLGLAARLVHSINRELESCEEEITEHGPLRETIVCSESHNGQYL